MMPEAEGGMEEHQELILPVLCTEGSGLMMIVSLAYIKQVPASGRGQCPLFEIGLPHC